MTFIPHTSTEVTEMLDTIGVATIEALFDEIPANLRIRTHLQIPPALTEMELTRFMKKRAQQDEGQLCFIGSGAYEHHIPAVVWDIASRGEFLTSYTPYQAEASQGNLQLLYEYQTMMASLMALDVSNASLYEGATALAEAILMAVRVNKQSKTSHILLPQSVHPFYRQVVKTIVSQQQIKISEIAFNKVTGQIDRDALKQFSAEDITALVVPQPNFFGVLEDVDILTNWAHAKTAVVIGVVNPLAMALLKPPGQWGAQGADIACGEGQPLGIPLASGGPYYGFLCCKKMYMRQLPGRIVGRTVDQSGKEGFVLTLQAREQHIRRAKATSNICTNQGLMVTASTIYMSLLGPRGLRKVALACHQNLLSLQKKLATVSGIKPLFTQPAFHEMVIHLSQPVDMVLQQLAQLKIQAGFNVSRAYPNLSNGLLLCVTETKTEEEIDFFVARLAEVLSTCKPALVK